jgi:voltage-gated potassium channel
MEKNQDSSHPITFFDLILIFLAFNSLILFGFLAFLDPQDPIYRLFRLMDGLIAFVFLVDFLNNIVRAPDRKRYFFVHFGWLDLLGGMPFNGFGIFRIARVIRGVRILLRVRTRQVMAVLRLRLAQNTLVFTLILAGTAVFLTGVAMLIFERGQPGSNIISAEDAMWWAISTISTVGYGDLFPVTLGGRIAAAVLMVIGISIFGVLSAYLANTFISPQRALGDASIPDLSGDLSSLQTELSEVRNQLDKIQSDLALLMEQSSSAPIKPDHQANRD